MPTFEFKCDQCGSAFELFLSIQDKEQGEKIRCPNCGSREATQLFTGVQVMASGEAADAAGQTSCGCGGQCGCR